jgi:predicted amino acid dehydrogenase
MKKIVSVSLGPKHLDYEFETELWGARFHVRRVGTEGDLDEARRLVREHDGQVDCIALGAMAVEFRVAGKTYTHKGTLRVARAARSTPVVGGRGLKRIIDRWAVREIARLEPNLFDDCNALLLSGIANWDIADVLSEYTDTIRFADPVLHFGAPFVLRDVRALKRYARGAMPLLTRRPYVSFFPRGGVPAQRRLLTRFFDRADVVVGDLRLLLHYAPRDLSHVAVVTDTIDDATIEEFRGRGVDTLCTTSPQVFEHERTSMEVLHALCVAHLGKDPTSIDDGDYLNLVRALPGRPRVIHLQGERRTRRKFAYLYYPPGRADLFRSPSVRWLRSLPPEAQAIAERVAARLPIRVTSRVTGVVSPTGAEADGWILTLPATAGQISSRGDAYAKRRLEEATRLAQSLGAQLLGVGAFSRTMADATRTVARTADLPITSGASFVVSACMWAAKAAVLQLGIEQDALGRAVGTAMVVGAGDKEGGAAAELLALVFHRVVIVDRAPDRLLELVDRIARTSPHCEVQLAIKPDNHLAEAHLVVTGLAPGWTGAVDIDRLRPGALLFDCARPSEFRADAADRRSDVLIVYAGELELPGPAEVGEYLGPPPKVAFASLAETIVLALEERYECFSLGAETDLARVKEIYQLGLKHGFQLGAMRGARGAVTDGEIRLVREHAERRRRDEGRPPPLETTEIPPA